MPWRWTCGTKICEFTHVWPCVCHFYHVIPTQQAMGLQFFHSTFPDFLCVMSKKALRYTSCCMGKCWFIFCTVRYWQIFCPRWGRVNSEATSRLSCWVLSIMNYLKIEVCFFIMPTMLIVLWYNGCMVAIQRLLQVMNICGPCGLIWSTSSFTGLLI